eukprot:g13632.t1
MDEVGKLSAARIRYAERLLERLAREKGGREESGEYKTRGDEKGESWCAMKKFCIGIVGTEKRLDHRYLLQTVASLRGIGGVGDDCRTNKVFVQIRGDPLFLGQTRKEKELHADVRLMMDAGIDVDFFAPPYRLGQTYVNAKGEKQIYRLDNTVGGKNQWFSDEASDYRHAMDRRGIYADGIGASTIGIVFPRDVATQVVSFLENPERPLPLDELLLEFVEEVVEERKQFIIVPSLLQHTGMLSSSTAKAKRQQSLGELDFYRNDMKLASKFDDLTVEELEGL